MTDKDYLKARTILVEYLLERGIPEPQAHFWAMEILSQLGREGLRLVTVPKPAFATS